MMKNTVVGVALAMMIALVPAWAQDEAVAEKEPTVTMTATNLTAAEVASKIGEQTGVQVAVTEWTEGSINGTLTDFTVEKAVSSMGQAARASWVRFYMLETTPPDVPYTAAELIAKLGDARTAWFESLSDEQRQQMFGGMRGRRAADGQGPQAGLAREAGGEQPADQAQPVANRERWAGVRGEAGGRAFGSRSEEPGGVIAQPPRPERTEQGEAGPEGRFRGMDNYEDPLRGMLLPGRTDTITLDLTDAPLAEALSEFMMQSRFIVIADEGLTGEVTVQLEDAPLSEALAALAEAAHAQWRPVYIFSAPRQLTQTEIAQREATRDERRDQRFNEQWGEFWAKPPQAREAEIQQRIDRMARMQERMQQRAAENPERAQRGQRRMQRFGERMLTRMMDYSTQLTPEQRLELKPLLQSMAKMNARQ